MMIADTSMTNESKSCELSIDSGLSREENIVLKSSANCTLNLFKHISAIIIATDDHGSTPITGRIDLSEL